MPTKSLAIRVSKREGTALRKRTKPKKSALGTFLHSAPRATQPTLEPSLAKTGYDGIKHLIGSCKGGSDDLATNPKHMQHFGR